MKEKKLYLFLVTVITGICFSMSVKAQSYITGPVCVASGTTYMYNIQARWDSSATAKICVEGGVLTDYAAGCASGTEFSYAKISWNKNVIKGEIKFTSLGANASLEVRIIDPFSEGKLDTLIKTQVVDSLTVPAVIACSAALGGSCKPNFNYQWQQSADDVQWEDILKAINKDLRLKNTLKQTMFYRRKVTDSTTGSIAYSDEATVLITGK